MNKRGDLATFMLLFVGIAVMIYILYGFAGFSSKFVADKSSEVYANEEFLREYIDGISLRVLEEIVSSGKCDKDNFILGMKKRDFSITGSEVFFGKVSRGEFEILNEKEECVFRIRDVNLSIRKEEIFLVRNIDIEQRAFLSKGL